MNAIIEQARSLDGYQDSSELLQRRDQDWVLDRAGIEPRSLLDLGCGIGSLLLGGARRWPGLQRLWGIERSPLRLEQARARCAGLASSARLLEGDLLDLPPLAERFELISMTAVLHWLYPDEERLFRWVARHLEAQGYSCSPRTIRSPRMASAARTTWSPRPWSRWAWLRRNGWRRSARKPGCCRWAPARGREALRERVEQHFRVDSIVSRPAVLRVADSAEYQRFHAATFGTYFAPLVPATRLENSSSASGESPSGACRPTDRSAKSRSVSGAAGLGRARHNLMRNRSAARLKIGTSNCTRWHPQPIRMNRPCPTRVRHVFDLSPCSARSAWPALASPASRRQRGPRHQQRRDPALRHPGRRTGPGTAEHSPPESHPDRLRPAPGGGPAGTGDPGLLQRRAGAAAGLLRGSGLEYILRRRRAQPATRHGAGCRAAGGEARRDPGHGGGHRHPQGRCQGRREPGTDRCGQRRAIARQWQRRPARRPGAPAALAVAPGPGLQRFGADQRAVAARPESQPRAGAGERQAPSRDRQHQCQRRAAEQLHRGRPGYHPARRHRAHRGAARRRLGAVRLGRHRRGDQRHPQVGRPRRPARPTTVATAMATA